MVLCVLITSAINFSSEQLLSFSFERQRKISVHFKYPATALACIPNMAHKVALSEPT